MTLLQAKEKSMPLVGETLTTGTEYLDKINLFFDTAQKEIAGIKPIIKTATATSVSGKIEKPADARKVLALMTPDYKVLSILWVGNSLLADDGDYILEYEAYPTDILSTTLDTYQFEVASEAQESIPYYGAAMCVIEDNPALYGELMSIYNGKLSNLESTTRIRFVGGTDV